MSAHKTLVAAKLAEEAEEHKPKGEARKEKRVVYSSHTPCTLDALSLKCGYCKPLINLLLFGGNGKFRQQRRAMSYLKTTWTAKKRSSSRLQPRGVMLCFKYHVVLHLSNCRFTELNVLLTKICFLHVLFGRWSISCQAFQCGKHTNLISVPLTFKLYMLLFFIVVI